MLIGVLLPRNEPHILEGLTLVVFDDIAVVVSAGVDSWGQSGVIDGGVVFVVVFVLHVLDDVHAGLFLGHWLAVVYCVEFFIEGLQAGPKGFGGGPDVRGGHGRGHGGGARVQHGFASLQAERLLLLGKSYVTERLKLATENKEICYLTY